MVESAVESSIEVVADLSEKVPIRVLHVDDEAGFLKVAKKCLEMQDGFEVETAGSVEEAEEKMKDKTFDVVVSDYVMPGKDGLEFLKDLREKGNAVPFIIFTGRGREEVAIRALNLGADQYLNKGGDPETVYGELAHSIRKAVKRERAEKMLRRSEEEYRNLFENAKDVVVLLDLKGKITSINKAAIKYGFKKDEVIGKNQLKFIPKKYWPRLLKELVQIARGKSVEGRIEINTPEGKKDAEYRSNPMIADNKVVGVQVILRDITEHKKAEEELIRLSGAVKMSTDCIVIGDIDAKIIDVNEATLKMYGTDDKKDLIGKISFDLIAPEDREKALAGMKETLEKGYVKGREYNIITKDGGRVPVEMSVAIMKDADGKPVGFVGISRDITDRKKAEEALRESEEKLRSLLENIPDFVITVDRNHKILMINRGVPSVTVEQAIGTKLYNYVEPAHHEIMRKSLEKVFQTGMPEKYEVLGMGPKGPNTVWYETRVTPNKTDDQVISVTLISSDITERKKAEKMLTKSGEKYRTLIDDIPIAVFNVNLSGKITYVNKRFEQDTGYWGEEIVGKNAFKLNLVSDETAKFLAKRMRALLMGKPTRCVEVQLRCKDGGWIWADMESRIIKKLGVPVGFQITGRNITERKRFEERLSALNIYSRSLNMARSLEEIYRLTLDAMEKTLGFEIAFFMVVDKDMLCVVDQCGYPVDLSVRLPLDGSKRGVSVKVARTGKPINVPDAEKEDDWVEFWPGIRSGLDVPVKIGRKVLGVIGVDSKSLNAFDEKDQKLLEILASYAATAMSNLEHAKNLKAYARETRESREKFERLFMDNPEATVYLDPDFHILGANPRFSELFKYSLNEIKGKNIDDVVVPKGKTEEAEMLSKKAEEGYVYYDTVRKKKDGTLVPVSISAAPIKVEGKIIGTVGLYRDITERKRFEERLSALNIYSRSLNLAGSMEEIYRLTLDAMEKTLGFENAAFMVVDKNMLYTVDQRGYPEILSFKLPLDGAKKGITIKAVKTGRPVLVPDTKKERDYVVGMPGMRSELDVPVKIGNKVLGVLSVESERLNAFDEKDQKLLEILASHAATAVSNLEHAKNLKAKVQEIRESQEKFERLFMDNPEAAVYMDSGFHILDINPRFRKLFGYSLEEVKDKSINSIIVPEDKMKEAETFDKRASKGEAYQEDTVRKRKDGTLVPVAFSAAPIIFENKAIGHVAMYKDISQLKKAEKALRDTMEELKMANEKMRVVGKLTRHDVRNKLSTVTGNVFLTKQKLARDREALTCLEDAESAVRQVERIFDFARTYEKLGVEKLTYINVEKSVKEAISLFSDLDGAKLVNDCRGLTVLADSLLRQLFYNLIDNSLKYGEKIGKIRIHYKREGKDQLKLVYEDDGVGMPKAEKEKIFEEGYGKGTGHGLYLIRKICEVYGWTITETGKHDKGAQFAITIPKMNESGKMNYRLS